MLRHPTLTTDLSVMVRFVYADRPPKFPLITASSS